jgi:regulator of protease activity HflC (stomatin/prohibitin superfamily)
MRKIIIIGALVLAAGLTSCTTVESGHEAPIVAWGGETDMNQTLGEGIHYGISYLWNDTPEYLIRNTTVTIKDKYYDAGDMETPVTVTVYYNPIKGKTNYLHKNVGPDYLESRLTPLIQGALAKVIPQYTAQNLNKVSRAEAEKKIKEILQKETPKIYIAVTDVQFSKVGIPDAVAELAKETAVQVGRNELAEKLEAEKVSLAKAQVAEAQGNYDAGVLNAKTKDILSQPKMLEMMRIENERLMWEGFKKHGHSPFGENNIFGTSQSPTLLLQKK